MTGSVDLTARQIMEVVPMVMRTLALEMRMAGHLPEAAHCPLLLLLAERPHNLSQLAVRHAVSLPTMSNSISTLVERGWVTRSRSPHDRRVVHVSLTPHGFAVLEEMRRAVEARMAQKLSCLSPAECDHVLAGLEILRECFARIPRSEEASR